MGMKSPQSVKKTLSLSHCYSLPLTDQHYWRDLSKLKNGLHSIDKCDLLSKDKVWCIYFGLFPKLSWPIQVYEESITNVETMKWLISKYTKKWLGVSNSLTNVALYSSSMKLKLLTLSLVEEFKLGKVRFFQMLHYSHDPLVKNAQPSIMEGENKCRIGH